MDARTLKREEPELEPARPVEEADSLYARGQGSNADTEARAEKARASREAVQLFGGNARTDAAATQKLADHGVSGLGGQLPHREAIQRSFGPDHDISGVRAHIGGGAAGACDAIGAEAYATGHDLAFKQQPSLWLAAHETAHVIQQRRGVQLHSGVGRVDDEYERNADAVADRVVAGESATDLLGPAGGGAGSDAVQTRAVQCFRVAEVEGENAKVSESGNSIMVPSQTLYATESLIEEANTKLATVGKAGSHIRLAPDGGQIEYNGKNLTRVTASWVSYGKDDGYHSKVSDANAEGGKDTLGQEGGPMASWTDCGRVSASVTGSVGGDREIVYQDAGKEKLSKGRGDSSVSDWLNTEPGRMANQVYWELIPKFIRREENAGFLKEGVHYTGSGESKSFIDCKNIVHAKSMYVALGKAGRDKFDKEAGINHYANPEVGESYSMATEGDMPGFKRTGSKTWNYHWGGVVMKDGSDNITLEGFAVTRQYADKMGVKQGEFIDRDWNFDMYGTLDKSQTFHAEHLSTNTHGSEATTIRVRTKTGNQSQ